MTSFMSRMGVWLIFGLIVAVLGPRSCSAYMSALRGGEVAERYDTIAAEVEGACRNAKLGSDSKCKAYAECYRGGAEKAWPPELIQKLDATPSMEIPHVHGEALKQLLAGCAIKSGLRSS